MEYNKYKMMVIKGAVYLKGIFIALEGPDGSGKSSIANLISEYLEKKGVDFIFTREPGGTSIGEDIRKIILDNDNIDMKAETEALLYAASRAQHVHEKIKPALDAGKIVICERFLLSSLAYQGVGRELGVERVKMINEFGISDVYPDLTLFFHIDPETALLRKTVQDKGDRLELEGNKFHDRVYKGYMDLIKKYPENIKIIDASESKEKVLEKSIFEIEKMLKKRRKMMKLIIAVVQDQDAQILIQELTAKNYRITKLASSGGFLKSGNTTLLMGVDDKDVNDILYIINRNCKTREITSSLLTVSMPGDTYIPYPLEVQVGGATVFVLEVEEYIKI